MKIIVFLYIFLVFNAGDIYSGILFADLLLPFMLFYVIFNIGFANKYIVYLSFLIALYGIVISILSIINDNNSFFFASALLLRTISFFIIFNFFIVFIYKKNIVYMIHALSLSVVISLITTLYNILTSNKAYYGYAQVLSTGSPALAAFLLGSTSIFYLSIYSSDRYFKYLVFSLISGFLCIFTLSLSGTVALLTSIILMFFLIMLSRYISGVRKLNILTLGFITIFLVLLFSNKISEVFYRFGRIFSKLDYRLEKVERLSNDLCQGVFCKFFGVGPGAHSYQNNIDWGMGSILAFDQLYGRILLEWGIVGSLLWVITFLLISRLRLYKNKIVYNRSIIVMLVFGMAFGVGSEFIFVAYSGSIWASFLGILVGLDMRSNYSQSRIKEIQPIS